LATQLSQERGGSPSLLSRLVRAGIAFHHGGLSMEERELIEGAYAKRILSVLACTSTLAAGVNLPARRVIVRSLNIGMRTLSKGEYKQMAGRAGRKGIDTVGESYLLCALDPRLVPLAPETAFCSSCSFLGLVGLVGWEDALVVVGGFLAMGGGGWTQTASMRTFLAEPDPPCMSQLHEHEDELRQAFRGASVLAASLWPCPFGQDRVAI
jgi:hypothetical protein